MTKQNLCKCGKNLATKPHACPYAQEINDDYQTKCTCCRECEQQCADDI